jgi:hypothetical protein
MAPGHHLDLFQKRTCGRSWERGALSYSACNTGVRRLGRGLPSDDRGECGCRVRAQDMVTIGRDIALTLIGIAGILHQELVGPVKPELLIVYTTLLGIPGAANMIGLLRGVSATVTVVPQSERAPSSQVADSS